jgi:hypothetical protein
MPESENPRVDVRPPERIILTFHCGELLGADGWCGRCQRTPDTDEYVRVGYRLDADAHRTEAPFDGQ